MKKSFAGFLRAGAIAAALLFSTNVFSTSVFAATALDPTKPGQYKAAFDEYKFPAKTDPLVTQFAKTEIWARIWYPSNKNSKSPLVVILHGNHNTCGRSIGGGLRYDDRNDYTTTGKCPAGYVVTPNHAGYDYVAKQLATNGYIVVSINANRGITAMGEDPRENDPGLIQRRGRMILRHMMLLSQWNRNGGQPRSIKYNLKGRIDFSKVTIMGHSRGGDAVVSAFNLYKTPTWKQRVPGVRFVGVAPLAPTDFQVNSPNVIGAPLSVLLPMCDGDVNRLSGIHFYDRSVQAATPDAKNNYKAVFATWGANHNGYNTQWQVDDDFNGSASENHFCLNQNKLFTAVGLNPRQQSLGRYYLMGFARGNSEAKAFDQLFNPAFSLPGAVTNITRVDRSFFAGGPAKRLVRFDGSCSSKFLISANTFGTCRSVPEHNDPTLAALFRWGPDAAPSSGIGSFALFVLNNGAPVNLGSYQTLDMRVAPDCQQHTGTGANNFCFDASHQGGGIGAQNMAVTLVDDHGKLSASLLLSSVIERRQSVALQFPGQAPANPLGHALFSSARFPISAFKKSGFNIGRVQRVRVDVGQATGGLFFGDIWASSVPRTAIQDQKPQSDEDSVVVASADQADVPADTSGVQVADITPASDAATVPAQDGPGTDGPAPQADAATSGPAPAADAGSSILSVERTTLKVRTGETSDDADAAPTRDVAAVAFTIATREQIVEGDALMSIKLGNAFIPARRFITGRENDTPSVIKLVVPADAVNAAADGAAFAVVTGGRVYHFGGLRKSAIR